MTKDLAESVARAMEADVRLLPILPELLTDVWELGTSPGQIVSVLQSVGVAAGSTVVDLGCGKGAVAVALAEHIGLLVEGIDAIPDFLEAARTLATERGVSSQCNFRKGDIRTLLGQRQEYDLVLLLSVGPLSGTRERTMMGLRTLVRPGGYMVIEDGFFADGVTRLPGAEEYANHADTLHQLTALGDRLLREVIRPAKETRAMNERTTDLIRKRARSVKTSHPDLAGLIDAYVARQERETEILGRDLICATWVLQRKAHGQKMP